MLGAATRRGAVRASTAGPGRSGWIVHRHGALYAHEQGYNGEFEALVAAIVGDFGRTHDPAHERCWIAEREAEIVGSVFAVRESDEVAKLRLSFVEPSARGLRDRRAARRRMHPVRAGPRISDAHLWTQSDLLPARRIYAQAGPPRRVDTASQLRPGSRRRDVDARAVSAVCVRSTLALAHELSRLARQGTSLEGITRRALTRAGLRRGMRVLDIGCGAGDVSLLRQATGRPR